MKKRIFLVSNMYPSEKFPHYGVFVQNTEKTLIENGYEINKSILYKSSNKIEKIIRYFLFYIITIIKGILCNYDFIYAHYASHTSLPLIIIKFFRPNCKLIMNVHGNDIVPENDHDKRYQKLVKKVLEISTKIISPSLYFKSILVNEYLIKPENIIVYPSGGIDKKVFYKMDKMLCKQKLSLELKYKYIGFASRIEKDKGWDILLNSIKQLDYKLPKEYKFLIVGSGSENSKFDLMVSKLNIKNRIIKLDFLEQKELSYFYNAIEFFVFPTYRKSESLGLVGLEAMACGKIVIASDNYGPKSYIENGKNGFAFKTGDYQELSKKILLTCNLTDEEKNMIEKETEKTVDMYSKENITDNLLTCFDNVYSEKPKKNKINHMEKYIIWVFILSLLVDNINGFIINSKINFPFSVGQLFRIVVMGLMLYQIYLVPIKKHKNVIKKYIRYFTIFSIYLFMLCIIYFVSNGFIIADFSEDFLNATKLLFPIMIILTLYKLQKEEIITKNCVYKIFEIYSIITPLTIIIPEILGIGFDSYNLGGVKGFYYANNEINIVLVCTFIYTFHKIFKKFDFNNLLLLALNGLALLMIGSKTSILTIVIVILAYLKKIIRKPKKLVAMLMLLAVLGLLSFIFLDDLLLSVYERINYFYITLTENGTFLDFLTSTRSSRIVPIFEKHIFSQGIFGAFNLIFGVGRSQQFQENVLSSIIEMDFFDTLFWYGLITSVVIFLFYLFIFLKNYKKENLFEFKIMFIIILLFSLIAGHVWYSPLSGGIFALVCSMLIFTKESRG